LEQSISYAENGLLLCLCGLKITQIHPLLATFIVGSQ